MEDAIGRVGARSGVAGISCEHRLRQLRSTSQQLSTRLGVGPAEHRLEELPDDTEAEVLFQLAPTGREHRERVLVCDSPRLLEEARLSDARDSLDQQYSSLPRRRVAGEPFELGKSILPLEKGQESARTPGMPSGR